MSNNEEAAADGAARTLTVVPILGGAGKLRIELAGVIIGHAEIPEVIQNASVPAHIKFEFHEPER